MVAYSIKRAIFKPTREGYYVMKRNLKTRLVDRKIKKPNPFLMAISRCVLGIVCKVNKVKFNYNFDIDGLDDKPVVLLATHTSRLEFMYTLYGFRRNNINMVCGYQNILKKGIYWLFRKLGIISKYLYQPDFKCTKNMLGVLKRNGALGLFPEGIQSTSGSTQPINPATTKFIKKSKAYVVLCTSQGTYMTTNRYSSDRKKGYIALNYSILFTPQTLALMTEEQIYERLLQKFKYNEFEFNKQARHKYIGKKPNAHGLNKILYKCPDCKREHVMEVVGEEIRCRACKFSARVNEYYDLVEFKGNNKPSSIDAWYKWQRNCVREEIARDNFKMMLSGRFYTIKLDRLRKPPKNRKLLSVGELYLNNKKLCFLGTIKGKGNGYHFDMKSIYSLTFSTKGFLEFYHNDDYYIFVPDDKTQDLIKWTLASEEIHNLYDEKWRVSCEDVYDYDKGEIYG